MEGQNDRYCRPGEIPSTGLGAFRPPGQGCNRGCRPSAPTQGLLFNVLCRAKENRRFSPHFRSHGTRSVPEGASLPHAYVVRSSSSCCEGRLVYVNRSDGHLLSCAYCGRTSPLSQVCLSGSPLAIPGTHVRPLPFSKGVYSVRKSGPLFSAGLRSQNSSVSGRLALCAPSRTGAVQDTCCLLAHVSQLGLKVNLVKSCLVPPQMTTFLGMLLEDICAASWASPSTFDRFYNVNVAAPHPLGQVFLRSSTGPSQ
ncbi:hypothetical protein ATANTOWER_030112 [Ataeniobius toweri]|uniref:Reverse transcriptase n=1 Tax=Ataeniobius toweri TaxID=208326 RepID=A0ABU7ABU4_9TELE|nr:hypothetical protein [Ataeniobius toweri]